MMTYRIRMLFCLFLLLFFILGLVSIMKLYLVKSIKVLERRTRKSL